MNNELIGKIVGAYTLIEQIGASDTSTVFRARQNDPPHKVVAIKFLPIPLGSDAALRARVAREMTLAANLKHPALLPVFEHGEDAGAPYVVMKLAEGGTLAMIIRRDGALPLATVVRVLDRIAAAVDYAHSQGVIHGDIKPGNILFDGAGTAYLGDVGVARLQATGVSMRGAGTFIGAVAYAAPELCVGEDPTPHTDLYALGVVLLEMLTGEPPFNGATRVAVMQQHIGEQPPDPASRRPELPAGVSTVIRRALSKQPAGRYQTAQAMSDGLKQALRSVLPPSVLGESGPKVERVGPAVRDALAPPASKSVSGVMQNVAPTRPTPPAARAQMQRQGKYPGAPHARSTPIAVAAESMAARLNMQSRRARWVALGLVLAVIAVVVLIALLA